MIKWIKDNLVLVTGIVLPILLVVGFFILNQTPKLLAGTPAYDFLLVAYRYDYQHPREFHLSFEVRDGQLQGKVTPAKQGNPQPNRQFAAIFRYSVAENRFDEIGYDLPGDLDKLEEPLPFIVQETAHLKLDKNARSQDGFTFEYLGYRGRGGLLGEIFGMGRRYESEYVLNKDGGYVNLPRLSNNAYYYQHDMHFMGWITAEGSAGE